MADMTDRDDTANATAAGGWAIPAPTSTPRRLATDVLQGVWTLIVTSIAAAVGLWVARVDVTGKLGLVAALVAAIVVIDVVLASPLRTLASRGSVILALVLGFGTQVVVLAAALGLATGGGLPIPTTLLVLLASSCVLAIGRWFAGAADSGYIVGAATAHAGQRISRRRAAAGSRGLLVVMLDGVALPTLRRAIAGGQAPNIARWLTTSHHLTGWWSTIPSTTPAAMAGLLYGSDADVPAFRWWDRRTNRLLAASNPSASALVEERFRRGSGLLRGGVAISATYSGEAARSYLVISNATRARRLGSGSAYIPFFSRPFLLPGALVLTVGEMVKEVYQGRRQRVRGVEPRIPRKGVYVVLRGLTNVMLRKLNLSLVAEEMANGAPIIFVDFVDYDEIAHHAGPERPEAMRAIEGLDGVLGALEQVARRVGTRYELVVVSDHGQSLGRTFTDLTGGTFPQLVTRLLAGDAGEPAVACSTEGGEDWGPINAFASAVVGEKACHNEQLVTATTGSPLALDDSPEVVVTAGGNVGSIWFPRHGSRPTLPELQRDAPRLLPGLLASDGIGLVMVADADGQPLVLGRTGSRRLGPDPTGTGDDPLAGYPARAAQDLARLHGLTDAADVIVISTVDELGNIHALEQQVGSHGGIGGPQNQAILLYPRAFELDRDLLSAVPELGDRPVPVGPWTLYRQLVRWRRSWAGDPADATTGAAP